MTRKATRKKTSTTKSPPPSLKVEYRPLSELRKWPKNPKNHDIEGIQRSIRRFGFAAPVVIDEKTGRLVAGHGRQEALSLMHKAGEEPPKNIKKRNGDWLVPVVRGNQFASRDEAERYLIADNRFVELGGWDPGLLLSMIGEQEAFDLGDMGFDEASLKKLTRAIAAPEIDDGAELVQFTARKREALHQCPSCGHQWSE